MGAIMSFAIFPVDKGDHIGGYVSEVVSYIKNSGYKYQFSPMGTVVEAATVTELLAVIDDAYKILYPISDRVYCVMNMDYNKNKEKMIDSKTQSIESRIGKVLRS